MSNEDVVGDISSDSSAIEEKAYIDESDENGENEEETGKSEDTDDIGDSQDENSVLVGMMTLTRMKLEIQIVRIID